MAFDLSNIREASYKGATFLMTSSSVSSGRKDVVHEFVNSDKQTVEDLGKRGDVYNITGIIHGQNYERDKKELISKLNDGKRGILVHPFAGVLEKMSCRVFTVSENFTEFGIATFTMTFTFSEEESSPERDVVSSEEVSTQRLTTMQVIQDALSGDYFVDNSLTGSFSNALDGLNNFIESFDEAIDGYDFLTNEINSLSSQIIEFNNNIASLVQTPVNLAQSIYNLYITANNAFPAASQTLDMMKRLFFFESNDKPLIQVDTAAQNEINNNITVLNNSVNAMSLANAYYQMTVVEYTNTDEIEKQEKDLEDQYDALSNSSDLSAEVRRALNDLRYSATQAISEIKTTTPDLIDINIKNEIPLRKLEYMYYGENTRTESLISINKLQNIDFVSGDLEILNDKD